jgi:hypothetical protein
VPSIEWDQWSPLLVWMPQPAHCGSPTTMYLEGSPDEGGGKRTPVFGGLPPPPEPFKSVPASLSPLFWCPPPAGRFV